MSTLLFTICNYATQIFISMFTCSIYIYCMSVLGKKAFSPNCAELVMVRLHSIERIGVT